MGFVRTVALVRPGLVVLLTLALTQTTEGVRRGAPANSRYFQMAVWTYEYPGPSWESTTDYADVPMFGHGNAQPPQRSILRFDDWYAAPLPLSSGDYDWARILAVVVDEPYVTRLDAVPWTGPAVDDYRQTNPCSQQAWNVARKANVAETKDKLLRLAASVHAIAPKTRFWVNFHDYEVRWMRDVGCPLALNDASFDVVSLDKYEVPFSSLEDEYEWFLATMPHQQIALVPGLFREANGSAYAARRLLYGYFDYANAKNRACDIGYGRAGRTGNYDGCRVWIVAGWSAVPWFAVANGELRTDHVPGVANYVGLLHPSSAPIADTWRAELAKTQRSLQE